jgi:hypothetical protein
MYDSQRRTNLGGDWVPGFEWGQKKLMCVWARKKIERAGNNERIEIVERRE